MEGVPWEERSEEEDFKEELREWDGVRVGCAVPERGNTCPWHPWRPWVWAGQKEINGDLVGGSRLRFSCPKSLSMSICA